MFAPSAPPLRGSVASGCDLLPPNFPGIFFEAYGSPRIHRSRLGLSAGGVGVVVRIFLRRPRPPRDVLIRGYRPWSSMQYPHQPGRGVPEFLGAALRYVVAPPDVPFGRLEQVPGP